MGASLLVGFDMPDLTAVGTFSLCACTFGRRTRSRRRGEWRISRVVIASSFLLVARKPTVLVPFESSELIRNPYTN